MNLNRSGLGCLFLTFAFAGCSSTTVLQGVDAGAHPAGHDAGTEDSATPLADSGAEPEDTGTDTGTTADKPATPTLVSAEKLAGNLHVSWKLNDTKLTAVELWRKKDQGTYAKAYTLPGTATSQHDGDVTAPGTFCYQVKTFRGTAESDFSPEKCGTP